jgi:hypothetical protein
MIVPQSPRSLGQSFAERLPCSSSPATKSILRKNRVPSLQSRRTGPHMGPHKPIWGQWTQVSEVSEVSEAGERASERGRACRPRANGRTGERGVRGLPGCPGGRAGAPFIDMDPIWGPIWAHMGLWGQLEPISPYPIRRLCFSSRGDVLTTASVNSVSSNTPPHII